MRYFLRIQTQISESVCEHIFEWKLAEEPSASQSKSGDDHSLRVKCGYAQLPFFGISIRSPRIIVTKIFQNRDFRSQNGSENEKMFCD